MAEKTTRPATAEDLVEVNSAAELRAIAAAQKVDSRGTKPEIAQRLIDAGYTYDVTVITVDGEEPEPESEPERTGEEPEEPVDGEPAAAPAPEVSDKPNTPKGLKPPKVKRLDDGSRQVTVKREMTFIDLAEEIGYVGSARELAAFNGVRNGRMELHPGDKVIVPAPYDPRSA